MKIIFYLLFIVFIGATSGNFMGVLKACLVPLGIEIGIFLFHSISKWKQDLELTKPNWYVKLKHFNETKLTWYSKEEKERQQREKEEEALKYLIERMKFRHRGD